MSSTSTTMRTDEVREGTAFASMVRERLQLVATIADLERKLVLLTRMYASLALGLSVDSESLWGMWASLGAHTTRLRRYPGTEDLTLSFWVDPCSVHPATPDVTGEGPTLVLATRHAVGRLREWEQGRLAGFRARETELVEDLSQFEVCFSCNAPPGSAPCLTCTPSTNASTAASAA